MLSTEIFVAALALLGTVFGSLAGIRASNRLVEHRLKVLEAKMDQHNRIVERVILLENQVKAGQERAQERRQENQKAPAIRVTGTLGKGPNGKKRRPKARQTRE